MTRTIRPFARAALVALGCLSIHSCAPAVAPFSLDEGDAGARGEGEGEGGGEGEGEGEGEPAVSVASTTTRRLSAVELQNTYRDLVGEAPAALSTLPLDSQGLTFDRVVNTQTISPAHLEAIEVAAAQTIDALLSARRLDEWTPVCSDDIAPPAHVATTTRTVGSALAASPDFAIVIDPQNDPTRLFMRYGSTVLASATLNFDVGNYDLSFGIEVVAPVISSVEVSIDGAIVGTLTDFTDPAAPGTTRHSVRINRSSAGAALVQLRIIGNDSTTFFLDDVTIDGPVDSAAVAVAERRACAVALADVFGARAWRRPLQADERARLVDLYDVGIVKDATTGITMMLSAILQSPHFMYLIEIGDAVAQHPGWQRLRAYETASRLSYAVCEGPPDATLRAAAEAAALTSSDDIHTQLVRLLGEPCGHASIKRFFAQWLWLDKLPTLNRDTNVFAELTDDVRAGLSAETLRYVDEMVHNENASYLTMMSATHAWPDARSAFLADMSAAGSDPVELPAQRAGLLTLPGTMAATGIFDGTSPVHRGVFVLEQVLCQRLTPPPPELMVTPPPPDPNATTRERWRQHSDSPACAGCHTTIDPIGFALERFDGLGRYRTTENGIVVDDQGGVPTIGADDGSIRGGAELARAIAASPVATACFAKQWLRFALARQELPQDVDGLSAISATLATGSVKDALASIATTASFQHRFEEVTP